MTSLKIRESRELVRTETVQEERDGKMVTIRRHIYRVRRPAHALERIERRRHLPFGFNLVEEDKGGVETGDPIHIEYVASTGTETEVSTAVAHEVASFLDAAARKQRAIDLGINPDAPVKWQVRTGAGEEPPSEMPPTDGRGRFHGEGFRLKFSNLAPRTTEQELRDFLEEKFGKGPIGNVRIRTDDAGVSRGFGFVVFDSKDLAERCIAELDGKALDRMSLRIEWAVPPNTAQRV